MRLNIDRDLVKQLVSGQLPNKSRHLDELTLEPSIWQCDTGQWLSCFASCHIQLSIDHIVNGQYKRCGFAKTRLRHPSLPFDSLPYPTCIICRRVRTYARSVTWQPNEKRLTIFYEYGALSNARFAREGAPLLFKSRSLMFLQVSDDAYPILLEIIIALLYSVKVWLFDCTTNYPRPSKMQNADSKTR